MGPSLEHARFFHVHLDSVFIWGFMATLALTSIMSLSQWFRLSRMGIPFMLGTVFTSNRDRAHAVGFVLHLLAGWGFAFLYALVFETTGTATWWAGTLVGASHGVVVLTVLAPLAPYIHPRMATESEGPSTTRMLEPPGHWALHYGRRTPMVILVAHTIYGLIMGSFYRVLGS